MDDEILAPNIVKAFVTQEIKAVNKTSREVLHLITTASVDRAGDIVEPKGAEIANFMKNPLVMADHAYSIDRVIGRAMALEVSDKGISARTQFRDTPLGREAFALASEGLGGWSIGFRPMKFEPIKDGKGITKGFMFKQWELLEYSIVAIPCNPDIVQNAITRGLVTPDNAAVFFSIQKGDAESKPSKDAGDSPTAEAGVSSVIHPAMIGVVGRKLDRARRSFAISEAASRINAVIEEITNA